MSNREQVLALPELLENILLQLPTRDILFAQKVCKEWQEAIVASPKIQEALFFRQERATNGPSVKDATAGTKLAITANSLLLTTYAYFDKETKEVKEYFPYRHKIRLNAHRLQKLAPEASCRRMYITQSSAKLGIEWDMILMLGSCLTDWGAQNTSYASFTVELSLSALDNFGQLVEGFKAQVKGSGYDRHDEFEDVHCVVKLEDGGCLMTCDEV
ncbi:hypothetical protein LTR10_002705 [Elasticomyces elasticus]|nr:hypothetical protein LTR10_002705 [Elasticomyces elasticus]KAK4967954.1 hypothetical protein LTR42_010282 [Elasticomyces elasticus]